MKNLIMIICISLVIILPGMSSAQSPDKGQTVADTKGFEPPKPNLEFMSRFSVDLVAPIWELGQTSDLGKRRIIPITGGKFEGPLLNGKILNNGADWQIVTKDGLAIIDTRYLLQADDDSLIYLQTKGFRYGPPEVMAKVAKGEPVDPSQYYFRIYMTFETSSQKYDWLNRAMGIGYAMRLGNAVVYDAYLVK
ncbi:MAG: DUF3237 domain-containing protein [Syntrophobacteraceae bacterium]